MNIIYDQNYIRVIDNAISSELCDELIDQFETNTQLHFETPTRLIELGIWNLHNWPNKELVSNLLMDTVRSQYADYANKWDTLGMLPKTWSAEGFRVKGYRPHQHQFLTHVDQGDKDTATRFIGFLFYLNDSEAGTEFPIHNFYNEAKKGRLLLFPPNWMYPHRGLMPTITTKYIMSTYAFYT
jgi:hypothetical protein